MLEKLYYYFHQVLNTKFINKFLLILAVSIVTLFGTSRILLYSYSGNPLIESIREHLIFKFRNTPIGKGISSLYTHNSPSQIILFKNDSIKQLFQNTLTKISNSEDLIVPKQLKELKFKSELYDSKSNYSHSAKLSFHGSSITPYKQKYYSFNLKLKDKNYKYITELEMGPVNIFFNLIADKYSLIHEETGSLVLVNINNSNRYFYTYRKFDSNYLKDRYGFDEIYIFKSNTYNGSNRLIWHKSDMDGDIMNIEPDNQLQKEYFQSWKDLHDLSNLEKLDIDQFSKWLAIEILLGSPHDISGNNDFWLLADGKFYRPFRNEGTTEPLNKHNNIDSAFFRNYTHYYGTYDLYKNIIQLDNIRNARDFYFKSIIRDKNHLLNLFDSVYTHYEDNYSHSIAYMENLRLMQKCKADISYNFNAIDSHLNDGRVFIIQFTDHFLIKSDFSVNIYYNERPNSKIRVAKAESTPTSIKGIFNSAHLMNFSGQNISNEKINLVIVN